MNLKELQEELNRTNLAEEVTIPADTYRGILKDAVRFRFLDDKFFGVNFDYEDVGSVLIFEWDGDSNVSANLALSIDQAIKDE